MTRGLDLKRLIFNISALVDLGQEVTSSKVFSESMKTAIYVVTGMFSVPRAALFAYNSKRNNLRLLTYKGLKEIDGISLHIKAKHIKTFNKNEPYNINELKDNAFYEHNKGAFKRLQVKTFIPLFVKDEFVGAITLGRRLSRVSYLQSEMDVLKVVASQMAITLHNSNLFKRLTVKLAENKRLYENMRHLYYDTIQAFAAAIDAKDEYTKDHSYRVARYAVAIARELGWKEKDREGIYIAGILHDIGKIIIDSSVINKAERLSAIELREIRRHPQISYDIISKIKFPWRDVTHFVRHHHERVDGRGYPDSLLGEKLSDGVKILMIADALDAMTTDRPYRRRLPLLDTLREVKNCLGTHFDDKISNVFFRMLQKELKGELREPQIISHLNKDFDPTIITALLEEITA